MTIPTKPELNILSIAHRTLGWPDGDKRPIPPKYLAALSQYVAKHPNYTNFIIDLEDQGGVATCMDCLRDIRVGRSTRLGVYEFQDLQLLESHMLSSAHKQKASASVKTHANSGFLSHQGEAEATVYKPVAGRSGSDLSSRLTRPATNTRPRSLSGILPPDSSDVDPASSDLEAQEPTSPTGRSVIVISSSDDASPQLKGKPSIRTKSWTFPDGELVTIESSDDDNAGDVTFSQNTVMATPQASTSRGALGPRPFSSQGTPRARTTPRAMPVKRTISQPLWKHRSPARAPSVASSSRSTSASEAGTSTRKRPFQYPEVAIGFANGEETDGGSSIKKMRYDTDSEGQMETDGDGMSDENSDEEMSDVNQGPMFYGFDPRPRTNIQPGFNAQPQAGPSNLNRAAARAQNPYGVQDHEIRAMLGDLDDPYLTTGYHAPPAIGGLAGPSGSLQRRRDDFNLNYDNESPLTWLDHGGANHAEMLKRFFDEAMDDHEGAMPVRDAVKELGLKNATDRLPGMQVALMPHQLIGVSWMAKQELGKVQGGILADDMGLGKTMQTIALIVANPPEDDNPRKSTLIVAPAALLDQWRQEIENRTDNKLFKIRIHHGNQKLKTVGEVKKYDIIITTFQTLTNEFPADDEELKKRSKKKKKAKRDDDGFIISDSEDDKKRNKKSNGYGPLATTAWYRVVLDEAQNIRNRATRSSRAMAMLDSEYRWALTGTPVTNTLADLYGLVRFLHFAPFNDWAEFNSRIALVQRNNPKLAGQRAQALLKKCLLRRTKASKLEGKPLITLQPKTIEIEELEFSPEERQIYATVETRQQQKFNKFLRAGTVMKNYTAILVMLLRLRQVCNHPQLIAYTSGQLDADGAYVVMADEEEGTGCGQSANSKSKEVARAVMGDVKFELAMRQFRDLEREMYEAELTGGDMPENQATECGICLEPYTNDCCVTSCGHIFCSECLNELFDAPLQGDAAANDQFGPNTRPCPNCRDEIKKSHIFAGSIFTLTNEEKDEVKRQVDEEHGRYKPMYTEVDEEDDFIPIRRGKGKARARIMDEEDEGEGAELKKMGEGDAIVPGAKMKRMVQLLEQWHREAPEDKIIAYSQWTSMIDLMQILLNREEIETLRFDGQMSRTERDRTLSKFKKQGGPKILLISLKCGGFGLNLTEANRVICMDLAWNAATENQAIDRVHRMGQVKSVFVKRLVVKDTIEDRILKLQNQKQSLSDAALGEGTGAKMPRMNVAQLQMLFGM